jgi:hypothetical protein
MPRGTCDTSRGTVSFAPTRIFVHCGHETVRIDLDGARHEYADYYERGVLFVEWDPGQ